MKDDDKIKLEDLSDVRVTVTKLRRKALVRSAAVSVIAGSLIALVFYFLKSRNIALSVSIGTIFFLTGMYYYVGWWRHYRAIYKQLDSLEQRVRGGETIYGSNVKFHSYH